jgi:hypothetical protein
VELEDIQERQDVQKAEPPKAIDDGVIDLQFLFLTWLKWIWVPLILAGFGLYSGYRDLQAFSPESVAYIVVLPSGEGTSQPSGVSGLAAQFGFQISAQSQSVSQIQRLRMLLGSVTLAKHLQEQRGILQIIFPGGWDPATQSWPRPTGAEFESLEKRRAFLRQNAWAPPNLESLSGYIQGTLKFEPIDGGPFQRVSVTHGDPEFALWILELAYFSADNLLREQDTLESARKIGSIQAKLDTETNVQFQEALRSLLTNELGLEITLNDLLPYAARIVEPARVSNRRTEPNLQRTFGVPVAAFASVGFLLTTLIAVFRREKRRR